MGRNQNLSLISCYAGEIVSLPKGAIPTHAILDGGEIVLSYSANPSTKSVDQWWVEMREAFVTGENWKPLGVGRLYKQNVVIAALRLEDDDEEDTQENLPQPS